jgi:organic radical activating enzyme
MSENWYCPLPFKHVFVDSTGVSVCCQAPRQSIALHDWTNSDYLKQFQSKISTGSAPAECQGCVKQEQTQGRSLRTDALADYNNQKFVESAIDFVDYRSNNICNFKCRTCDPVFSHGIANDVKHSTVLQEFYRVLPGKTVSVTQQNADWIYQNIDVINRLMITGGEPTAMPEVRQIVERVVYDQLDTQLLITTNGSFVDDFWFEATRQHDKLHWTVSIDAVGPAAELIRHGTNWKHVEKNVRWLASHASSLNINTVVSNLNLFQLSPLLEFVNDIQQESRSPRGRHGQEGCRHQFHVCQRPYHSAADNWPDQLKSPAIQHLESCLKQPLDAEQRSVIQGLVNSISLSNFDHALWAKSEKFNLELDKIRNQNYNTLYNQP